MSNDNKGAFVGHFECIGEDCNSSDALAVYKQEDGTFDGHCFSCEEYFKDEEIRESDNWDQISTATPGKKQVRPPISKEQLAEIKATTTYDNTNYRGIKQETNEVYKVRTKIVDGRVVERHYPVTKSGLPSAYKKRVHPKDFTKGYVGYNGKDCDLFGQSRFNKNGKYILIAAGEEDTMAAYQMLRDDQKKRGKDNYEPVAVVSSTIGEGGIKQVKHNYEYLVSFNKIIICPDNDDAGKKAMQSLLNVLPVGKTFVMECPAKDANEALKTGFSAKFVRAFYAAAEYNPAGIVGSGALIGKIIEYAKLPRLTLPPFLSKLQSMLAGGIPLGSIVNLASASGSGKSTLLGEIIYHWVFNSPYRMCIAPLEGGAAFFGESLLSRHLGKKIGLMSDTKDKVNYLQEGAIQEKTNELFCDSFGDDRFEIIDGEGSLTLEVFKERCEHAVRAMDAKVLILDPLTKMLEGEDFKDTQKFMKWQNDFVEQNKCIIINIVQVRKSQGGKKANSTGADLHEEDMSGAGAILQTGFCNILFMRNKEAEDEEERNVTKLMMSKCRWSGVTGPAGYMYYDNDTHTLHDRDKYFLGKVDDGFKTEEEVLSKAGAFEGSQREF